MKISRNRESAPIFGQQWLRREKLLKSLDIGRRRTDTMPFFYLYQFYGLMPVEFSRMRDFSLSLSLTQSLFIQSEISSFFAC